MIRDRVKYVLRSKSNGNQVSKIQLIFLRNNISYVLVSFEF